MPSQTKPARGTTRRSSEARVQAVRNLMRVGIHQRVKMQTFYLDSDTFSKFAAIAKKENWSYSMLIETLIEDGLARWEEPDDE